jgi:dihydropteroate synthase
VHVEKLGNSIDLPHFLKQLGVDGGGVSILRDKGTLHLLYISDLHVGAANILKQDALSIGADLAVPKGTVIASQSRVNALLIAKQRQLQELAKKERAQPFGLKLLAESLEGYCRMPFPKKVEVMGIINANEDSFYQSSRFQGGDAVRKIEEMIEEGADIIDIGGVSSRPGSVGVDASEELNRLRPIIDALYAERLYEKVRFSLDSFEPVVIAYALERGFSIINDITGFSNDDVIKLCAAYGARGVIMHMQGNPQTMQRDPSYHSVLHEVELFFRDRLAKAESFGVKDVILDTGIGFGKRLEDNLALITHQSHFLALGKPLLVGASRKSLIDAVSKSSGAQRLPGTLAIHLKAVQEGASVVRVHDVKEHVQALKLWQALKG